jgi:hypothetical protein
MISKIRSLFGSKSNTKNPLQNNQQPSLESSDQNNQQPSLDSSDISEDESSRDNLEKVEEYTSFIDGPPTDDELNEKRIRSIKEKIVQFVSNYNTKCDTYQFGGKNPPEWCKLYGVFKKPTLPNEYEEYKTKLAAFIFQNAFPGKRDYYSEDAFNSVRGIDKIKGNITSLTDEDKSILEQFLDHLLQQSKMFAGGKRTRKSRKNKRTKRARKRYGKKGRQSRR